MQETLSISKESTNRIKVSLRKYLFPGVKIGVVIPAYNEKNTIGKTLQRFPTDISDNLDIIVVNDGSTDNTREIAEKYNVKVINLRENHGNGAAVRKGMEYCRKKEYDVVVTLDADGQHDPQDIAKFVEPIINGNIDFVVGNRFEHEYYMKPMRKFCSRFMSVLYSIIFRKKIIDPTNGFRAFSPKVLKEVRMEANYSTIQEMLFKVVPNYSFKQVPTLVSQRLHGNSFIKLPVYLKNTIILFIKTFIFSRIERK